MADYAHFDNTRPVGGYGLGVGSAGSEVKAVSATGDLYHIGTKITASAANLNAVVPNPIQHDTTSDIKVIHGTTTASTAKTIATGLTAVLACWVQLATNATPDGVNRKNMVQYITCKPSAGNIKMKGWRKSRDASPNEYVAAKTAASISWVAMGTG